MIIINKYNAPKNCSDCFALDEYGDYPMCRITGETRGYNFDTDARRMDRCPIEVTIGDGDVIGIVRRKRKSGGSI